MFSTAKLFPNIINFIIRLSFLHFQKIDAHLFLSPSGASKQQDTITGEELVFVYVWVTAQGVQPADEVDGELTGNKVKVFCRSPQAARKCLMAIYSMHVCVC